MATDPDTSRAAAYSALAFLRRQDDILARHFLDNVERAVSAGKTFQFEHGGLRLWTSHLQWDSDYFGVPTYRIDYALGLDGAPLPPAGLSEAIRALQQALCSRSGQHYIFAEVPAEDAPTLQGLGLAGFRLIETRLTYYRDDIQDFHWPQRFRVRQAVDADIVNLRETAASARNPHDRFHADPLYAPELADAFLATFAENSVRGFADVVLVPADPDRPPDAFLTAVLLPEESRIFGKKIGRMVLSAVRESRSGWYLRLVAEMSHWMREHGAQVVFLTTQSSNRAVIRVWEKLGYRYGRCTHILAALTTP